MSSLESTPREQPPHRRTRVNQRLLAVPSGAVLTSAWLRENGLSNKLADYYVRSGWLHRIGDGAFTIQRETPNWHGAVFGLQQGGRTVHPGGRTALEYTARFRRLAVLWLFIDEARCPQHSLYAVSEMIRVHHVV